MKREHYVSPDRSNRSISNQVNSTSPGLRVGRQHTRLSSSAPSHEGFAEIWQRREPRKHLLSTGSLAEAGSTSSISTGGVLSPDPQDFSHDEFDSDEESDADHHYEDVSSDNGRWNVKCKINYRSPIRGHCLALTSSGACHIYVLVFSK